MAVSVANIRQYLRIDSDFTDDDVSIHGLIGAAQDYIKNTTGKTFISETPIYLYDLAVTQLCAHWYLNRGTISDKSVNDLPYSVTALMQHLSFCGAYV